MLHVCTNKIRTTPTKKKTARRLKSLLSSSVRECPSCELFKMNTIVTPCTGLFISSIRARGVVHIGPSRHEAPYSWKSLAVVSRIP